MTITTFWIPIVLVVSPRVDFLQHTPIFSSGELEVHLLATDSAAITACREKPHVRIVVVDHALAGWENLLHELRVGWPYLTVILFSATEISSSWKTQMRHKFSNVGPVLSPGGTPLSEVVKFFAT